MEAANKRLGLAGSSRDGPLALVIGVLADVDVAHRVGVGRYVVDGDHQGVSAGRVVCVRAADHKRSAGAAGLGDGSDARGAAVTPVDRGGEITGDVVRVRVGEGRNRSVVGHAFGRRETLDRDREDAGGGGRRHVAEDVVADALARGALSTGLACGCRATWGTRRSEGASRSGLTRWSGRAGLAGGAANAVGGCAAAECRSVVLKDQSGSGSDIHAAAGCRAAGAPVPPGSAGAPRSAVAAVAADTLAAGRPQNCEGGVAVAAWTAGAAVGPAAAGAALAAFPGSTASATGGDTSRHRTLIEVDAPGDEAIPPPLPAPPGPPLPPNPPLPPVFLRGRRDRGRHCRLRHRPPNERQCCRPARQGARTRRCLRHCVPSQVHNHLPEPPTLP